MTRAAPLSLDLPDADATEALGRRLSTLARPGDVILQVGDKPVRTVSELLTTVASLTPGTAADFLLTMLMRWSRNMPTPTDTWPVLQAYAQRMKALPSFKEVYAREGLTDWT